MTSRQPSWHPSGWYKFWGVPKGINLKPLPTTNQEWYFWRDRDLCADRHNKKSLSETSRPVLISTMRPDLPQTTHRLVPNDTIGDILFLRLKTDHLSPKDRILNGWHNARLGSKTLFSTTRDHKHKFEVPERLPLVKSGKLWKKERVSLLILCITVLLTSTNTS